MVYRPTLENLSTRPELLAARRCEQRRDFELYSREHLPLHDRHRLFRLVESHILHLDGLLTARTRRL